MYNPALYGIALVAALFTAFYSIRATVLAFYGDPRDQELHDSAHESGPLMTIPLWILAALSILGGLLNLPVLVTLEHWLEPALGHHELPPLALELFAAAVSFLIAIFGSVMALSHYRLGERWPNRLIAPFRFMEPVLENKWYVDEFYNAIIVRPLLSSSRWLAASFDQGIVDSLVNWFGSTSLRLGDSVRRVQTGLVPTYAFSILLGVVVIVAYFSFV